MIEFTLILNHYRQFDATIAFSSKLLLCVILALTIICYVLMWFPFLVAGSGKMFTESGVEVLDFLISFLSSW